MVPSAGVPVARISSQPPRPKQNTMLAITLERKESGCDLFSSAYDHLHYHQYPLGPLCHLQDYGQTIKAQSLSPEIQNIINRQNTRIYHIIGFGSSIISCRCLMLHIPQPMTWRLMQWQSPCLRSSMKSTWQPWDCRILEDSNGQWSCSTHCTLSYP